MFESRFNEIFPNVDTKGTVTISHITNVGKPICVFGVLETHKGLQYKEEMLKWLESEYNIFIVSQKKPGVLYEYPALRFLQWYLEEFNVNYALYLHTKGAANVNATQKKVREMWSDQFTRHKEKYINLVDVNEPIVVTPLSGDGKQTWFNGFFSNKEANRKLGTITPNKNRYHFEDLYKDVEEVPVIGVLKENCVAFDALKITSKYHPKDYPL